MSEFNTFRSLIQKYLIGQNATVEDVVKYWIDPVTNSSSNRLPYFLLPVSVKDVASIKSLSTELGKIKPYDFVTPPVTAQQEQNSTPSSSSISSSSNTKPGVDITYSLQTDMSGIDQEVKQTVYGEYPTSSTNTVSTVYVRLYLRSIAAVWDDNIISGSVYNFSNTTRAISYREKQAETITLSTLVYNTFNTPWFDIYKTLLTSAVQVVTSDNSKSIELYVPYAGGYNATIYRRFLCDVLGAQAGTKFEDLATLNISMIVSSYLKTRVIIES